MIREKRIKSGSLLEIDFYPVFGNGRRLPSRAPKENPSSAVQARYNRNQATKKLIRLVNANFDESDFYIHPTYKPSEEPDSAEKARRDMNNFVRRIKRRIESKKKAIEREITKVLAELETSPSPSGREKLERLKTTRKELRKPFKYIYCIEKASKWHFHMFISGCSLTKAELAEIWGKGRLTGDKYNPSDFGPEAAAAYMAKDPKGRKSFAYSRNLKKPKKLTPRDGFVTRGGLAKMAQTLEDDASYWECKYKGYRFLRGYGRCNKYNNHWYLSVVMYKADKSPTEWKIEPEDWLTDDFYLEEFENEKNTT